MHFVIPGIVFLIVFYGFYKKIDVYEAFISGVKEGLSMALKIFPTMFAMVVSIDILIKSNALNALITLIEPICFRLSIPKEILPLAFIRPISGSSSLVLMSDLLKTYGPDSFIGRVASLIQGSTDTTIYIIGLYFSSIGIKKIKYSLIVGLLADLFAIILSILVVSYFFY